MNNLLKTEKNLLLTLQLKNFGLNPHEWSIQKLHSTNYLVQHKEDKTFSLYGKLEFKKKKPSWKSLELISI